MDFQVKEGNGKLVWAALGVAGALAVTGMTLWVIFSGETENVQSAVFYLLACGFLLYLSGKGVYCVRWPRIDVKGDVLICYPRKRKKSTVFIQDITERQTAYFQNTVVNVGGQSGYTVSGGKGRDVMKIIYLVDGKELITIHT